MINPITNRRPDINIGIAMRDTFVFAVLREKITNNIPGESDSKYKDIV